MYEVLSKELLRVNVKPVKVLGSYNPDIRDKKFHCKDRVHILGIIYYVV